MKREKGSEQFESSNLQLQSASLIWKFLGKFSFLLQIFRLINSPYYYDRCYFRYFYILFIRFNFQLQFYQFFRGSIVDKNRRDAAMFVDGKYRAA